LKGERALGVAIKYGKNWKYVGLLALYDPPRIDSAETLKIAQRMGVHVKIITGDHKAVTQDIARKIDLGNNIISISEIKNSSDFYNYESLERADGISEVFPEHKYNIVKLLQDHDHIVGMTGDGVNDAPALKKANCGIAVANSTDAAKSSADIVLTKAGTSVIIDSIIESRNIFQRMNNYAIYRIAETMRLMLFITASILIFGFYPISAVMIVLLVILNDVPILTIAYDNVLPSDMPVRWKLKNVLKMATFLGVLGVISSFLMLYIGLDILHLSLPVIQTLIFLKLAIAGHLMVFTARTKGHFWSIAPAKSLLFATLGTQIVATLVAVYGLFVTPIGWGLAIFAWLYAILFFLITNAMKVELYKRIG
jgi:H+-transporting ATPase